VVDWETVRELALALPQAEEDALQSRPAFRVRGKLFVWMSPHKEAEGALVVRADPDEKPLLLESNPDVYFTTPHYAKWAGVLIRPERIEPDELRERIEDSWLLVAPKRVAKKFLAGS
jgi:hypothetical protein